jgi:hypothetical protein
MSLFSYADPKLVCVRACVYVCDRRVSHYHRMVGPRISTAVLHLNTVREGAYTIDTQGLRADKFR